MLTTMLLGEDIISYAMSTGDLKPFIDAGFNSDWMNNKLGGSWVLFTDSSIVYKYLLEHYDLHGKVPDMSLFRRNFPAYRFTSIDATAGELVEAAVKEIMAQLLSDKMKEVQQFIDEDDIDGATEFDSRETRRIEGLFRVSSAVPLFDVLTRDDLWDIQDAEPLIRDVLDRGTLATIFGSYSTAKTFIALEWSIHIARGMHWRGHITEQGKVLFIAAEGGKGQKKRLAAWEQYYGKTIPADYFHMIVKPVQFGNCAHVDWLCDLVRSNEYVLVVVDTQARCTVGCEENSTKDMGLFADACGRIQNACSDGGTTVLIVHHSGKDASRGGRGASSLPGAMDTIFRSESKDPMERIKLAHDKAKDTGTLDPMFLRLEVVELKDERFRSGETSCVLVQGEEQDSILLVLECAAPETLSHTDIVNKTKLGASTVSRRLERHVESGKVIKSGSDKRPQYSVKVIDDETDYGR